MDQDAFRNLLAAPRTDAGPSRGHQKGNFGGVPPKRGWGLKQTKEHKAGHEDKPEKKVEHIAPRHAQKKQSTEAIYKDRAEMRRAGKDDEYKDVEQMLADFEKRKAEAEDAETVEKTRQYLGGDATHSVLVKGLDFSLLAQRKAELEREKEGVRDEELDAMMEDIGNQPGPSAVSTKAKDTETEKMGKGFKKIVSTQETGEKKKKKKKKRVEPASDIKLKAAERLPEPAASVSAPSRPTSKPVSAPAPEEPEDDIFGDAGEYDLGGGAVSEDESEVEEGDTKPSRGRSVSREVDNARWDSRVRSYSRSRSRSRSLPRHRDDRDHYQHRDDRRSPARRDWYEHRDRPRSHDRRRSYSRSPPRRQYRSPSREPARRYRSPSRSPPRRYRSRSRSPYNEKRRRYDSPSRSPPPRRRRSPSPFARRDRSQSPRRRSPSPVAATKPSRRRTRSPSPFMFGGPPSRSPSLSRSPSPVMGGKLQPLQSSAITDLSGFLAAESAGAKADERKMKKAKWRASQGLGVQEGVDPGALKREMNDKQKTNREYVLLMNKLEKDKAKEGGSTERG